MLSVLLIPIYYAVRNVLTELPKGGKWKIRWERFFQAALNIAVFLRCKDWRWETNEDR